MKVALIVHRSSFILSYDCALCLFVIHPQPVTIQPHRYLLAQRKAETRRLAGLDHLLADLEIVDSLVAQRLPLPQISSLIASPAGLGLFGLTTLIGSWTVLLARLEHTLPSDVAIQHLQPQFGKEGAIVMGMQLIPASAVQDGQ